MAVYGTNCLKFAGQHEDEARPWLARELHIVQPKLVVVMGEDALGFVNGLEFPLADPVEAELGTLQRFTPTVEALVRAGHRRVARRAGGQDALLERLQARRDLVGGASAVLGRLGPRVWAGAALLGRARRLRRRRRRLPDLPLWWDVALVAVVLIPAMFALVWLALPLREWRVGRPGRRRLRRGRRPSRRSPTST